MASGSKDDGGGDGKFDDGVDDDDDSYCGSPKEGVAILVPFCIFLFLL